MGEAGTRDANVGLSTLGRKKSTAKGRRGWQWGKQQDREMMVGGRRLSSHDQGEEEQLGWD